jgi:hypothetical protein
LERPGRNVITAGMPAAINEPDLAFYHSAVTHMARSAVAMFDETMFAYDGDEFAVSAF